VLSSSACKKQLTYGMMQRLMPNGDIYGARAMGFTWKYIHRRAQTIRNARNARKPMQTDYANCNPPSSAPTALLEPVEKVQVTGIALRLWDTNGTVDEPLIMVGLPSLSA
jgi:hypothetical protein